MNGLVLALILAVTTLGYLIGMHVVPRPMKYAVEIMSGLVLLVVLIGGTRNRFQFVRPAYWFAFAAVAATMLCGALANSIESGPLFAGLRSYLRAVPLFFLPAVYAFSERQIRSQLFVLLMVCLAQLPIAFTQRLTTAQGGGASGDATAGTLLGSGLLSVFLISALCVLTAAFLRKQIRLIVFLPLFVLVLLPTTLNETKATVVMLPIALLVTFIAGSQKGTRLKNSVVATSLLAVAGAIFVPVYDYYSSKQKYGVPILEFFSDKKTFERYVSKEAGIGTREARVVGRVDALLTSLREMSKDPTHLAFGLGIGNASDSSLGPNFTGKHFQKFAPFLKSAGAVFILEIGLLGLALVLTIDYLIYRDSRAVAETDSGIIGTLAVGWAGVTAVIVMGTFYALLPTSEALSYLFWFYSGVVAAERVRLSHRATSLQRERVPQHRLHAAGA
jgi:hypothetical protein